LTGSRHDSSIRVGAYRRIRLARSIVAEAFELEELRRTPMETKLMQLCALMASRDLFAEDPEREKGVAATVYRAYRGPVRAQGPVARTTATWLTISKNCRAP